MPHYQILNYYSNNATILFNELKFFVLFWFIKFKHMSISWLYGYLCKNLFYYNLIVNLFEFFVFIELTDLRSILPVSKILITGLHLNFEIIQTTNTNKIHKNIDKIKYAVKISYHSFVENIWGLHLGKTTNCTSY